MAQSILQKVINDVGDNEAMEVSSAGIQCADNPTMRNARLVVDENGYPSLDSHKSRQITLDTPEIVAEADLILVMESWHKDTLVAMFPQYAEKIHLLTSIAGKEEDVVDPFPQPIDVYRKCFEQLRQLIESNYMQIIFKATFKKE